MGRTCGRRLGRGLRAAATLGVVVAVGAAGCADSHFTANGVDARRTRALADDPFASFRTQRVSGMHFTCRTSPARYVSASGEPLDFAAVQPNELRCAIDLPPGTADTAPLLAASKQLLHRAVEAGWEGVLRDEHLQLMKRLVGAWDQATVSVTGGELAVIITAPPHTSEGFAPTPRELRGGEACLSTLFVPKTPLQCS